MTAQIRHVTQRSNYGEKGIIAALWLAGLGMLALDWTVSESGVWRAPAVAVMIGSVVIMMHRRTRIAELALDETRRELSRRR